MTKIEFIEKVREKLIECADETEWYRVCNCTRLFDLCMAKRRGFWDMINLIEKSENKAVLIDSLEKALYAADTVDYYVYKNMIGLAELADARSNAIYQVLLLAENDLEDFTAPI